MNTSLRLSILLGISLIVLALTASPGARRATAQNASHDPTWWDKYQFILNNGSDGSLGTTASVSIGANVDVSMSADPKAKHSLRLTRARPGRWPQARMK